MTTSAEHTAYLAAMTPAERAEYDRIRALVYATLPGVADEFSYKMPGFTYRGKHLLWVGVFKRHMSLFPGTLKFTPESPLSDATILELIARQQAAIEQR